MSEKRMVENDNVRPTFWIPRQEWEKFSLNIKGKYSNYSDALRSLIRKFNEETEEKKQ